MKHYIVYSKPDDYGACRTELTQTVLKNAKQYYNYRVVDEADADTLKRYLSFVDKDEEKERSNGERFYGAE